MVFVQDATHDIDGGIRSGGVDNWGYSLRGIYFPRTALDSVEYGQLGSTNVPS